MTDNYFVPEPLTPEKSAALVAEEERRWAAEDEERRRIDEIKAGLRIEDL